MDFVDEGEIQELKAPTINTQTSSVLLNSSAREGRRHTIPDFLSRPYMIDNFNWSQNETAGTVLRQYRFPDVLLSQPAIFKKVANFFGFRAGVEFTVLVNKQQFQQGNLMISYLPGAKYCASKNAACQQTDPVSPINLATLSGLPRVNLDLMDATRANLLVPYSSPFVYYNLLTGIGTIGDFFITVYSQLQDLASSGTVSVQVMARFVDIELEFPSGNDLKSYSTISDIEDLMSQLSYDPSLPNLEALQECINKKKEQFKFQMNSETTTATNFKQKALPNMAVGDEPNNSHLMSLSTSTHLPSTNMGQSSSNEMDFSEIVKVPVYFGHFNIDGAVAGGTNVWNSKVELLNFSNSHGNQIGVDYITYLGQGFSKWRTSFNFHFRFVKTTFHSLRVRIFFAPGATSVTGIDRNAVISKIVDLKDNNFAEFTVPFVWPHPFLNTDDRGGYHGDVSLGIIGVDVLTKMVNPDTVKSSIDVVVERSAGSDFCLNLPRQWTYLPTTLALDDDDSENAWMEDLTEEGIEPNPGPSKWFSAEQNDFPIDEKYIGLPSGAIIDTVHISANVSDEGVFLLYRGAFDLNVFLVPGANNIVVDMCSVIVAEYIDVNQINTGTGYVVDMYTTVYYHLPDQILGTVNISGTTPTGLTEVVTSSGQDKQLTGVGRWWKDLTTEGIEPNPGPVQYVKFSSDTPHLVLNFDVPNPYVRLQKLIFNFHPLGSDIPAHMTFYYQQGNKGLEVEVFDGPPTVIELNQINTGTMQLLHSDGTAPTGYVYLVYDEPYSKEVKAMVRTDGDSFTTSWANYIAWWANEIQTSLTWLHGKTWTTSLDNSTINKLKESSAVVTTSGTEQPFTFQMNTEQDTYREGGNEDVFERPFQSQQADRLVLGGSVNSINQLIRKSSMYVTMTPTAHNDIYLLPHAIGTTLKTGDTSYTTIGLDSISYFGHLFTFYRGGVNLKIVNSPDYGYNVVLDPDAISMTGADKSIFGELATSLTVESLVKMAGNIQQIVKPAVEGYGDLTIPFYSDSYMCHADPSITYVISDKTAAMKLPFTSLLIRPFGEFANLTVYRSACSDFEMSYLAGTPRLLAL